MILGYIRVSTIEQAADDRTSLAEQEAVIIGYAMTQGVDRFGVQIYSDAGVSARTPLKFRPEGERMLADAQPGDTVIASKMDRIFRSARDALEVIEMFNSRGVQLVLFDMGTQPVTSDGPSKMFFTMLAAFAEFERSRIRERMVQGKLAKQRKGGHAGGEAPYGYRIVGSGRDARLEPDETEQQIVELVRKKALLPCYTNAHMKCEVNRAGFRTRTGKPFTTFQIQRIAERVRAQ